MKSQKKEAKLQSLDLEHSTIWDVKLQKAVEEKDRNKSNCDKSILYYWN